MQQANKNEVEICGEENLGGDSENLGCLKVENDCPAANLEGLNLVHAISNFSSSTSSPLSIDLYHIKVEASSFLLVIFTLHAS